MDSLQGACINVVLEIARNISFDFVVKVAGIVGGLAPKKVRGILAMADSVNVTYKLK